MIELKRRALTIWLDESEYEVVMMALRHIGRRRLATWAREVLTAHAADVMTRPGVPTVRELYLGAMAEIGEPVE